MRRTTFLPLALLLAAGPLAGVPLAAGPSVAADPPAFEPNVNLADWHLLGPFPEADGDVDVDGDGDRRWPAVAEDEAALRPGGGPVTFGDLTRDWRDYGGGVIDFRAAFDVRGERGEQAYAYAFTEFTADAAREAVLALTVDDGAVAWLNGERVINQPDRLLPPLLDALTAKVSLRTGTNTLLLKSTQGPQDWSAAARLRPAGVKKPLVSFGVDAPVLNAPWALPTLEVELLDADGAVIDTLHTAGGRVPGPAAGQFRAFAPAPDVKPTAVRVGYDGPGLEPFTGEFTWKEATNGSVRLPLEASEPILLAVTDAETGEPISGAQAWRSRKREGRVDSGADGRMRLDGVSPLLSSLWVVAPEHEARQVWLPWPRTDAPVSVALEAGGRTLRGLVTDPAGRPLKNAHVNPGLYGQFRPNFVTDADGRFTVFGIPESRSSLSPTVTRFGHVAKDRFNQPLSDGVTEVTWVLEPAAEVFGRVTDDNGEPVAGVTVYAGDSRFASNVVTPSRETDAEGRYRIRSVPPGDAVLHVLSDDHAPAVAEVRTRRDAPAEQNFTVTRGAAVTGRVTDPAGNPVAGVTLVTDTWRGYRMFHRRVETDADGRFTLAHMPPDPVEVHAFERGYVSIRDLNVTPGGPLTVTMRPVLNHTVTVARADGDGPPEGVTIQKGYRFPGREAFSWQGADREATASYDAESGIFEVGLDEPSNAEIAYRVRAPGYSEATVEIPADAGEAKEFTLTLAPAATVTGRVVDADTGAPRADVHVLLVDAADRFNSPYSLYHHPIDLLGGVRDDFTGRRAATDADGRFTLSWSPPEPVGEDGSFGDSAARARPGTPADSGPGLVLVAADTFLYLPDAAAWLGSAGGAGDAELPLPAGGTLEGRVTVAGEPRPNAEVRLEWQPREPGVSTWDLPFGVGGEITADADGRFRVPNLGPGRYRVNLVRGFDRPGGGGMSMFMDGGTAVVEPGGVTAHGFTRPPGVTLTGRTVDPDGTPLPDCVVVLAGGEDGRDRIDAVRSDADGRFTFKHVPPGPLSVEATHYAAVGSNVCGLGDEDFQGTERVRVAGDPLLGDDAAGANEVTVELLSTAARRGAVPTIAGGLPPDFTATRFDPDADGADAKGTAEAGGETDGEVFRLSEHLGRVVAIDFWATWCGPCLAVMPEMKAIHERYGDSDEVTFVTVSLDSAAARDDLRGMMADRGIEFPVLFSGRAWDDPAARAFGVTGIPSSFVIGRDGRFAADKVHGSRLAAAIEEALAAPADPAFGPDGRPARLEVTVSLDGEDLGVPGMTLTAVAIGPDGDEVRRDELPLPGRAGRVVWPYPPLPGGGRVEVTATADGFDPRTEAVEDPGEREAVAFAFASPRTVSGRVTTDDGTPAAGVTVRLYGDGGLRREAGADDDGRFTAAVLPGRYRVGVVGNDRFAAPSRLGETVDVPADADPDPLELSAVPALTLAGTVVDGAGEPVAGAAVYGSHDREGREESDAAGRFELAGVASAGESFLYARDGERFGSVKLTDPTAGEPVRITLGVTGGGSTASVGGRLPPLDAATLDGDPASWEPSGGTVLVLAELAHPHTPAVLIDARRTAAQSDADLRVVALDWTAAQARRAAAALGLPPGDVLFAGPGGLTLSEPWRLTSPATAFVLDADGIVRERR